MSINFLSRVTRLWHCAGGICFKFRPGQSQYGELALPYSLLAESRVEGKTLHDRLFPQYFLNLFRHYHNHPIDDFNIDLPVQLTANRKYCTWLNTHLIMTSRITLPFRFSDVLYVQSSYGVPCYII